MTNTQLQDAVMAALVSAKHVTEDGALDIATKVLNDAGAGKQAGEFEKWFKDNGAWLVRRVNG